jgi:hypothetical protein
MKKMIYFFLIALGLSSQLAAFIQISNTGINWDSVFDLNAAYVNLNLDQNVTLVDAYDAIPLTSEFYGTFLYNLSNWVSLLFTSKPFELKDQSLDNFHFLQSVSFFCTFISILIMSLVLRKIFSSDLLALLYFVIASTSPSWLGMAQVNTKDMPFAAGVTILSAGVMLFLKYFESRKNLFIALLLILVGSSISLGTRVGGLLIVLAVIIWPLILFILVKRNFALSIRVLISSLIFLIILFVSIYLFLSLTNPLARIDFKSWIIDAFWITKSFPSVQPVRALGVDLLSDQLPFWYIPSWIFAQLPLLMGLVIIPGAYLIVNRIIQYRDIQLFLTTFILSIHGLFVPITISALQINMYNGIRHIYFIFPFIFFIIAFTFYSLIKKRESIPFYRNAYIYIFLLLVLLNLSASVRWSPYSYAFINPIAGFSNDRTWDLDYWGVSGVEGVTKVRQLTGINEVVVMPDSSSTYPVNSISSSSLTDLGQPYGIYVYIHWNHKILKENCDILFEIKRDNQTLGMGGVCPKKVNQN